MEKTKPYLTFSRPQHRPISFLFKKAAEKNAALMRELTVEEEREARDRLAEVRLIAPGSRFESVECGGVPCEWVFRDQQPQDKVLLYLHGGSWTFGNLSTARPVSVLLTGLSGIPVLTAEYRLSPEHPYPAGGEDCVAVYQWLLDQGYLPENVGIFGDSAGGNLSLALIHRLLEAGKALPGALGLASPVPDLSEDAFLSKSKPDLLYSRYQGQEQDLVSLYCGNHDPKHPFLSPVYGDFTGFPPMLIHVGGEEPLSVDCDIMAQKAYRSGVDVTLKIWREMYHDFTIVGNSLKESRKSLAELAQFFRQHLKLEE